MSSLNTTLNFNIGVLGHIDSGKTSIAKALSTVASTASFDKNPQSRERGITLDLGFSSFTVDAPDHITYGSHFDKLQFTLVDCPGHASLIRTIIGGAQIVDMMMLVVDITKGIQTQTAECLIIGDITCSKMVVVLNKIDLIAEQKRESMIEKMQKRLWKTLENTKFAGCSIIAVAAKPGGIQEVNNMEGIGIRELIETLKSSSYRPLRISDGPLLFSIDHCFLIKGQGTVMTGTMLSGSISIQDTIEIPSLKITKKVKSIQMFKTSVTTAIQGDRIGICVTQFDPKLLERGLVCKPGTLSTTNRIIVAARKISYFKGAINSKKGKFHITVGHETTMGICTFFEFLGGVESDSCHSDVNKYLDSIGFNFSKEYVYKDELPESNEVAKASENDIHRSSKSLQDNHYFAVVDLDHSINCAKNFLMIASKLDTDIQVNTCRLAFHGPIISTLVDQESISNLKVFKTKSREGIVERMVDAHNIICKNLFKKETKLDVFIGLKVKLSSGEIGIIEGMFGQSGKTKIRIPGGLQESTCKLLIRKSKQGKKLNAKSLLDQMEVVNLNDQMEGQSEETIKVILEFKRYIFDSNKKIIQT